MDWTESFTNIKLGVKNYLGRNTLAYCADESAKKTMAK
jgi:hypothetical protein